MVEKTNAPKISLFKNAYKAEPVREITLDDFVTGVRSGRWKKPVQRARAIYKSQGKSKAYNDAKKKIPAVSLSGTFSYRNADSLIEHSGQLQIDIDDTDEPAEQIRDVLAQDKHVLFAALSPSAAGVKAIVPIDGEKHLESFLSAEKYFLDTYGYKIDPSVKDVSRLCFATYDPDCYYNPDAERLPIICTEPETISAEIVSAKLADIDSAETQPTPNKDTDAYKKRADGYIRSRLEKLASTPEGGKEENSRHGRLIATAHDFAGLIAGGAIHLTEEGAAKLLIDAATTNGEVKTYGLKQVERAIEDGFKQGRAAPQSELPGGNRPYLNGTVTHKGKQIDTTTGEIISAELPNIDAQLALAEQISGAGSEDAAIDLAAASGHLENRDWFKLRRALSKHVTKTELDAVWKDAVQKVSRAAQAAADRKRGYSIRDPKTADYEAALRSLGYSFRMNELDDSIELVSGERVNDAVLEVIYTKMHDLELKKREWIHSVIVAQAHRHKYHPIKDYLNGLKWDGGDHIGTLLNHLTFSAESADIAPMFIRKWLVGAVAKVFQQSENFMLVMDGKQGTGKSYLARWLCPLPDYFSEAHISPHDKDSRIGAKHTSALRAATRISFSGKDVLFYVSRF